MLKTILRFRPVDFIQSYQASPTIPLANISRAGASTEVHIKYFRSRTSIGTEIFKCFVTLIHIVKTD